MSDDAVVADVAARYARLAALWRRARGGPAGAVVSPSSRNEGHRMSALPRIGFIGIGMMGHGMAKNLLAKGYPLTFKVNRDRSRLDDLIAAGAQEAKSNAEVARGADIVFLCVSTSPQIEAIVHGPEGLLSSARNGLIVVDTSTAEPSSTERLRADFARRGTRYIDAPLARTPKEAEEGRLNTMVGAEPADFAAIKPVLQAFCENVFHVGPPGSGHVLKLVNNMLAMSMAALDRRSRRGRGQERARARQAVRGGLGRRRQLRHLPDDGRQDAAGRPRAA